MASIIDKSASTRIIFNSGGNKDNNSGGNKDNNSGFNLHKKSQSVSVKLKYTDRVNVLAKEPSQQYPTAATQPEMRNKAYSVFQTYAEPCQ
jgi:hypothetical protein